MTLDPLRGRALLRLAGLTEMAAMACVSKPAVVAWRLNYPDFPRPVADLCCGKVYDAEVYERWLRRHKPHLLAERSA
jgi:hypothetical protein